MRAGKVNNKLGALTRRYKKEVSDEAKEKGVRLRQR
jgi:hypothetical protein